MKFSDCEIEILRNAIDKAQEKEGLSIMNDPKIKDIITIVENFLRDKKLVCYGGTAINNILPIEDQFYNKEIEIPDYDFFSINALKDAKELADIYFKNGYDLVEAKAGSHHGTYKVFVNFIPIADITQIVPELYNNIKKEGIKVNGIIYCPPNFLRMSMYLELSRPKGDISRWEKVLKRLILLNKNYPIKETNCDNITKEINNKLLNIIEEASINLGLVFFGGYANNLYSKYLPKNINNNYLYQLYLLSNNPKESINIIKERLTDKNIKNIKIIKHENIGELVSEHYELTINDKSTCFIYKPVACHSYNTITINGKNVNVATIETILSFYLAFIYSNRKYYNEKNLLCMAKILFNILHHNRLTKKKLLRRFSLKCYGKQKTQLDMRLEKYNKYNKIKNNKNSKEYEEWFLKYVPFDKYKKKTVKNNKLQKKNTKRNKDKNKKTNKLINIE